MERGDLLVTDNRYRHALHTPTTQEHTHAHIKNNNTNTDMYKHFLE